jgi:hypothetical protein
MLFASSVNKKFSKIKVLRREWDYCVIPREESLQHKLNPTRRFAPAVFCKKGITDVIPREESLQQN